MRWIVTGSSCCRARTRPGDPRLSLGRVGDVLDDVELALLQRKLEPRANDLVVVDDKDRHALADLLPGPLAVVDDLTGLEVRHDAGDALAVTDPLAGADREDGATAGLPLGAVGDVERGGTSPAFERRRRWVTAEAVTTRAWVNSRGQASEA